MRTSGTGISIPSARAGGRFRVPVFACLLVCSAILPAFAYLLPSEMVLKYAREPWKGTEPFRISAKHTITRPNLPTIQTVAEIDFGANGQFRFSDKAPEGSLLVRDGKSSVEVLDGKPVQPVMDLYGFRWLFMPTSAPSADRIAELKAKGYLLQEAPVQMLVDRLLVRGLQVEKRRITACDDRKRPCYVIGSELAPRQGDPARSELWLDSTHFRPEKWIEVRGITQIETRFEGADPAKFGGFPAVIRISAAGIDHFLETQDYQKSPKLSADHFSLKPVLDRFPKAAPACPEGQTCPPPETR